MYLLSDVLDSSARKAGNLCAAREASGERRVTDRQWFSPIQKVRVNKDEEGGGAVTRWLLVHDAWSRGS
jgi:hypothetical protein